MNNDLKTRLTKLLDVKSIITILFSIAFIILVFLDKVTGDQFTSVFNIIVAFYWGTQQVKKETKTTDKD